MTDKVPYKPVYPPGTFATIRNPSRRSWVYERFVRQPDGSLWMVWPSRHAADLAQPMTPRQRWKIRHRQERILVEDAQRGRSPETRGRSTSRDRHHYRHPLHHR